MFRKTRIIKLRNKGFTYNQIGKIMGVSKQRVHQLLKNLKNPYYPPKDICSNCGDTMLKPIWSVKGIYGGRLMRVDEGCRLMLLSRGLIEE